MAKKSRQTAQSGVTAEATAFFDLPRTISKEIRQCAAVRETDGVSPGTIRYLWLNIADHAANAQEQNEIVPMMNADDWLNIIDEAASLGVSCVVICTGDALHNNPDLWAICDWAQRVHGLDVGIHARCTAVRPEEIEELQRLDHAHTWLFVSREDYRHLRDLERENIHVRIADVCREDHEPPCDMPEGLVFVAPDGNLYTCGLVIGNEQYRLGHIMERPLNHVVDDPSLPRFVPKSVPYHENGCAGCPPILAKRMVDEIAQASNA